MKPVLIATMIVAASCLVATTLSAQTTPEQKQSTEERASFTAGTATTLSPGRREVGLFGPLRYGLNDRVELSSHPLWFFLAPNLRAKFAWYDDAPWSISSRTGVTYPTPLLRVLSREGAGGIHPPARAVPHIVSIFNELVASRDMGDHVATAALGLQVAPRFGTSEMISIDMPVVYARTAAFFTVATVTARAQVQGPIAGGFGYQTGLKSFAYPGADGGFSVEYHGRLRWQSSQRWMVQAGYLVSYGGYPFGHKLHGLPLADIIWSF